MPWERNQKAGELASIDVDDIVNLRCSSGFRYLVKVIITVVSLDTIKGQVEGVFDGDGQGEITAGDPTKLVGQIVKFSREHIYHVAKSTKLRRHS